MVLVFGVWCLVFGVAGLVFGVWCVVLGVWCLVFGVDQRVDALFPGFKVKIWGLLSGV